MPVAIRLQPFGETVFAEFSRLAAQHRAVNLGQGFPNFDGPEFVKRAAADAIIAGHNQYARTTGLPALNAAIAARFQRDGGHAIDPEAEITVTSGCTEALAATFLGLINPGDEVILFEPYYDSYRACAAFAGATPRFVTLRPPAFGIEEAELRAALTPRTRAILVNTPHNPTGRVFSKAELDLIARVCIERDLIAIADEVYEHITFGVPHIRIATLDGMRERTITLSSLGKTFSLTGWKVGWAIAPPHLTQGIRAAHQFITFATATPLQHAAGVALAAPEAYFNDLRAMYRAKRDLLADGLARVGFRVFTPDGTYFILADHTPFGFEDDTTFCLHLVERIGVAAIPPSSFYEHRAEGRSLVRFAFCKDDATLREAISRLSALRLAR
jgi:aspartate/methionine/tyrosine aminotransferase